MPTVPGILQDRDRPVGSGHCGAEKCEHWSHQPVKKTKKGKKNG